jgi:hypothetical protein
MLKSTTTEFWEMVIIGGGRPRWSVPGLKYTLSLANLPLANVAEG